MNDEDFENVRRQMLEWNERLFGMAEKAFRDAEERSFGWPEGFRRMTDDELRRFGVRPTPNGPNPSPAEQSATGIKHAVERTGWEQTREISIYYDKLWLGELGIKG